MRVAMVMLLGFCTGLFCLPIASAQSEDIEETGKSPLEANFVSDGQIRLSLCPGAITLTGGSNNLLRVSYTTHAGQDNDVKIRIQVHGGRATIGVWDCPHNNFQLRIEVPKISNLYARMFAGEMKSTAFVGIRMSSPYWPAPHGYWSPDYPVCALTEA